MGLENISLLETVELAIKMEEEGAKFYALAEGRVGEPEMAEMFRLLRNREYEHMNIFRRFYSDIASSRGDSDAGLLLTDPEVGSYLRAFVESSVFPTAGAAERAIAGCRDNRDILGLALRAEKDSILYYRELVTHSPYPEAAEVLERIIGEERRHLLAVHEMMKRLPA